MSNLVYNQFQSIYYLDAQQNLKLQGVMVLMIQDDIIIHAANLSKGFSVRKKKDKNRINRFFSRKEYDTVHAVQDVSFQIKKGEFVGLIGNNGAGKSTLIKMMSGILQCTGGELLVFGRDPCKNRIENNKRLSVVFGQRTQLKWDLSVMDTFRLLKIIYEIDDDVYQSNVNQFVEMFDMEQFLHRQVRTLSLGQRMRCEISAALLHNPELIFLDEPTIGLDVFSKDIIADFLLEIKKRRKTTLILTTHDLNEISKICDRTILVERGSIVLDKPVDDFMKLGNAVKSIEIVTQNREPVLDGLDPDAEVFLEDYGVRVANVEAEKVQNVVTTLMRNNVILDIKISETSFTDIIKKIYKGGVHICDFTKKIETRY